MDWRETKAHELDSHAEQLEAEAATARRDAAILRAAVGYARLVFKPDEVETKAKEMCRQDGMDPDEHVIGGQAQAFEDYGPRWLCPASVTGEPSYAERALAALAAAP